MITLTDGDFEWAEGLLEDFRRIAIESSYSEEVDGVYMPFEEAFYYINTQISLLNIVYYLKMNDTEASERYLNAYAKFGDLYNLYVEACKEIYNSSPLRDEIFADWSEAEIEEMLSYDPETQELREMNEELLVELNELGTSVFDDRAAEIYALLVTNNNKIAELSGYDNYYDYATEKVYMRDYGREEAEDFAALIREYYLPIFDTVNNNWMGKYSALPMAAANCMYNYLFEPFDQIDKNYLKSYIESFDGSMREGLEHMFANRNVIFTDSPTSHPSAFQTYLREFETPFCLFGNQGQTTDTLVHEMGHYYAALYNPDLYSYDLAEVQSQGNEMLLLNYISGNMMPSAYKAVRGYKLFVYLAETIVCVIIDEFEREVYSLDSVEGFTSEDFDAIMAKVCENYGGVAFVEENITDINYYWRMVATNNPLYYISYAVSMTEALNILAVAEEDTDAGRELYRKLIEDVEKNTNFLEAMEMAGLSSPFEEETYEKIVKIMLK
jgi:oligoendopeptidase F